MSTPEAAKHRDIEQRFKDLDRKIRDLASVALRRPKFEVSEGDLTISGGDLVVDGGDFLLLDTDGSTVFRLGPQQFGDRGVSLFREDGTLALGVRKALPGAVQTIEIRDAYGSVMFSEEALGSGIAHPYLQIPMQPVLATAATLQAGPHGWQVPCTSATFVATYRAAYARLNQFGYFRLQIAASDTTTAAEVQVVNSSDSQGLGPFLDAPWIGTRAAGSTGYVEVASPQLFLPGTVDQAITLDVRVRRSAGVGTLQVALVESRGTSS